jgi:DNA polymerase III sliding clamp (beta) subunit (PCNA family)
MRRQFAQTEPLLPGVIRPTDDADYLCVLMPMQVV